MKTEDPRKNSAFSKSLPISQPSDRESLTFPLNDSAYDCALDDTVTGKLQRRFKVGELINRNFRVLQDPLVGAMAEVYKCRDQTSGELVAVKTLRYDLSSSLKLNNLLKEEAATWLDLGEQKNAVSLHSVFPSGGHLCLLSEWIEADERGRTSLTDWLVDGCLDLEDALNFAMDVCAGLHIAQAKVPKIVHRDLKPSNVLIGWTAFFTGIEARPSDDRTMSASTRNCRVERAWLAKINDWGLSRVVSEAQATEVWPRRTNEVGTCVYMAPEQWNGWTSDERTDIYAVGLLLFEMLAGRPPFSGTSRAALKESHLHEAVPKLPSPVPNREALQEILNKCLAKHPFDRYEHALDLLYKLAEIYKAEFGKGPRALESNVIPHSARKWHNRGLGYLTLGLHDEAMECLEEAVHLEPKFAEAHAGLAQLYIAQGKYREAVGAVNKAIKLKPAVAGFYIARGVANKHLNNSTEVLEDFARAIDLAPNDCMPYTNRGNLYSALGKFQDAIRDYTEAIRLDPAEPINYRNRSRVYDANGDSQLALEDLTTAIRLEPADSELYVLRAETLLHLDRPRDAVEDCKKALDWKPNSARAFRVRAKAHRALYALERSNADLQSAARIEGRERLTKNHQGVSRYDELLAEGHSLAAQGDHSAAVERFRWAIQLCADEYEPFASRGLSLAKLGNHAQAISDFTRAIELDKREDRDNYHLWRGISLRANGDLDRALEDFNTAVRFEPRNAQTYFNRAACLDRLKRPQESIRDYGEVLALEPENHRAYNNRGLIKLACGLDSEALEDLKTAYKLDPQDSDYCVGLGAFYFNRRQYDLAAPYFERGYWLGDEESAAVALRLREQLKYSPPEDEDPLRVAFHLFMHAGSPVEMRRAVLHCPFIQTKTFRTVVAQPRNPRLADEINMRLKWLSDIVER